MHLQQRERLDLQWPRQVSVDLAGGHISLQEGVLREQLCLGPQAQLRASAAARPQHHHTGPRLLCLRAWCSTSQAPRDLSKTERMRGANTFAALAEHGAQGAD